MSESTTVWIDAERCTGCGVCVELCQLGAISLVADQAHVSEELCNGCGLCLDGCPENAVHPLVYGEIIKVEERAPLTIRSETALIDTAGAAVTMAGVSLLAKVAGWLARAIGRWLAEGYSGGPRRVDISGQRPVAADAEGDVGAGRRARHRRRKG